MPRFTDSDLKRHRTQSGWVGDGAYAPPGLEALADLSTKANVLHSKRPAFTSAIVRLHRHFCDQAAERKTGPHAKPGVTLRSQLRDVTRHSHKLLRALDETDAVLLAALIATTRQNAVSELDVIVLQGDLKQKLATFVGLCEEIDIGSSPGPDQLLLRQTLLALIALYETTTGRKAGLSRQTGGNKIIGPLPRLLRGFFALCPKTLLTSQGIDATKLNRAITNAFKAHKAQPKPR